jgi:hypothetical protein
MSAKCCIGVLYKSCWTVCVCVCVCVCVILSLQQFNEKTANQMTRLN